MLLPNIRRAGSSFGRRNLRLFSTVSTPESSPDSPQNPRDSRPFRPRYNYTRPARSFAYDNRSPQLYQWTQDIVAGKLKLDDLIKTPEYAAAVEAICDTTRHTEKNLLNLLKSVIIMNIDPESRMVKYLENELIEKADALDLRLLIEAYELFSHVAKTSELRGKVVSTLQRRMSDILETTEATLPDLLHLLRASKDFPTSILIQIDQQITRYLDYHEDINLDSLCYLVVQLSRFGRRNKPLIRNVVSKLLHVKTHDVYTMPPHIINMLSALGRLNYYEINLIEKSVDLLIKFDFWSRNSDSSKRDFLMAMAQFNFFQSSLMEYFIQNLNDRGDLFKPQDLISLVITFARMNCRQPDLVEVIKNSVVTRLGDYPASPAFHNNLQWFNYVYALKFMGIAGAEQVKSLLSIEAFMDLENAETTAYTDRIARGVPAFPAERISVPDVKDIYQVMSLRRKWLTFVGMARADEKEFAGMFAGEAERAAFEDFVDGLEFVPLKRSKDLEVFRTKIQKVLGDITPESGEFYRFDKTVKYGFTIDVELAVNAEGHFQALDSGNADIKKIALMCVGFNDTQLDSSSDLIGAKEIEFGILRSLGYIVVPVHQNVLQDATALGKVTFLQNLIVSHLKD